MKSCFRKFKKILVRHVQACKEAYSLGRRHGELFVKKNEKEKTREK